MLSVQSALHSSWSSSLSEKHDLYDVVHSYDSTMLDFVEDVRGMFETPLETQNLVRLSRRLQEQFKQKLHSDPHCMLPSYNHALPDGNERGTFLALDVGGSNLRVALVELRGRSADDPMQISKMETWPIDNSVRALEGLAFFDWLAARIEHMLTQAGGLYGINPTPVAVGLAWSFPITQTSIRGGTLLGMGKGFTCHGGVLGQDLGEVLTQACRRRNIRIRMEAIVNDSSATLLSSAYLDSSSRFALVFGTGMNAAIHLPVAALGPTKFTSRPKRWHERAENVLVNTELSMFGKGILPTTRWDDQLNTSHLIPDYQPFEYLVAGHHMGEIVRLIIVEMATTTTTGLFGGTLPPSLQRPYSLDTHSLAILETDNTPTLHKARAVFQDRHPPPTPPTPQDLQCIQLICRSVSRRATAYLATGIHALWRLQIDSEGWDPRRSGHCVIGCNGSVINKYPGFLDRCRDFVDALTEVEGLGRGRVLLEPADESSVLGAAVAVALALKDESEA